MNFKAFFIMIFALLAAQFGLAQGGIVVFEGAEAFYKVDKHHGSDYLWEVYKDFDPDVIADPSEYEFTSRADSNAVGVQWKVAGPYYLKVTEQDIESCSNVKARAVLVLPNNNTIEFEVLASSSCYSLNDNSFELSLKVLDDNGIPLASSFFPLEVAFKVSDDNYSQVLEFDNQVLQIKNEWLNLDSDKDTNIMVELTTVIDNSGRPINPLAGKEIHTATIFGQPKLEFTTSYSQASQGENLEHIVQLLLGNPINAEYSWGVDPLEGTSTNLISIKGTNATILWDGPPGNYSLSAQVLDGNGCTSQILPKNIEIMELGDLVFASEYPNTIICSDLNNNEEGSVSGHSQSTFQLIYDGSDNLLNATVTIKNPLGNFIGLDGIELPDQQNPGIEISNSETDKTIEVVISDSWNNNSAQNEIFVVELISGSLSNQIDIIAEEGLDIERNINILPKPVIDFK